MSGRRETRIDFAVKIEQMSQAERYGATDWRGRRSPVPLRSEACRRAGHALRKTGYGDFECKECAMRMD